MFNIEAATPSNAPGFPLIEIATEEAATAAESITFASALDAESRKLVDLKAALPDVEAGVAVVAPSLVPQGVDGAGAVPPLKPLRSESPTNADAAAQVSALACLIWSDTWQSLPVAENPAAGQSGAVLEAEEGAAPFLPGGQETEAFVSVRGERPSEPRPPLHNAVTFESPDVPVEGHSDGVVAEPKEPGQKPAAPRADAEAQSPSGVDILVAADREVAPRPSRDPEVVDNEGRTPDVQPVTVAEADATAYAGVASLPPPRAPRISEGERVTPDSGRTPMTLMSEVERDPTSGAEIAAVGATPVSEKRVIGKAENADVPPVPPDAPEPTNAFVLEVAPRKSAQSLESPPAGDAAASNAADLIPFRAPLRRVDATLEPYRRSVGRRDLAPADLSENAGPKEAGVPGDPAAVVAAARFVDKQWSDDGSTFARDGDGQRMAPRPAGARESHSAAYRAMESVVSNAVAETRPDVIAATTVAGPNGNASSEPVAETIQHPSVDQWTQIEKADIVTQLVEKARAFQWEMDSEIVVSLRPESLGRISLRASLVDRAMVATITAESDSVRQLIQLELPAIQRALHENGMSARVDVTQQDYLNLAHTSSGQNQSRFRQAPEAPAPEMKPSLPPAVFAPEAADSRYSANTVHLIA